MKKGFLWILLVVFILCDICVISSLINKYTSQRNVTVEEDNNSIDTIEGACFDNNANETNSWSEDDYEKNGEDEVDTLSFSSGDVVDLIDDGIPCIKGYPKDIYEKKSDDNMLYEKGKSNYGREFLHIMTCGESSWSPEVSFSLHKDFSTLFFTIGLWENSNQDTGIVEIYKGYGDTKKRLLTAKRTPGQKERRYSVDVSGCDVITIRLENPDFYVSYLVTDGFKLIKK